VQGAIAAFIEVHNLDMTGSRSTTAKTLPRTACTPTHAVSLQRDPTGQTRFLTDTRNPGALHHRPMVGDTNGTRPVV
jgi:hypothetical protein